MLPLRHLVRASVAGAAKRPLLHGTCILTCIVYTSVPTNAQSLKTRELAWSNHHQTNAQTIHSKSLVVFDDKMKKKSVWQRILSVIRLLFHCGRLFLLSVPLVVTYPIARIADSQVANWWWRMALWSGQRSSPAIIKFLQWASTRRDMFSSRFCNTFQEFHANCDTHPWQHTLELLEEAFGQSWASHMELDPKPIGSGVIAQVYQGKWRSTDERIAVKVIHPHVVDSIGLDLELLWVLAGWVDYWLPNLSAKVGMQSFAEVMTSQLDLRIEANNLIQFQKNFASNAHVGFPTPKEGFVTESVLVESFVDGKPISPTSRNRDLAKTTIDMFLRMLFLHNFAHGDIHPGNILVTGHDGIALLDAGIVNQLLPSDFVDFITLFHSIASKDGLAAGRILLDKSPRHHCKDEDAFCSAIASIVDRATKNLNLKDVPVGDLLQEVLEVCQRHHVALQGRFVSVVVSIGVLEGVGRLLDPELDILKIALPILIQAKLKQRI